MTEGSEPPAERESSLLGSNTYSAASGPATR